MKKSPTRIYQFFVGLLLISLLQFNAKAQDAILLVVPNLESKIVLDGIEQGATNAGEALRLSTTTGQHYVEAHSLNGDLSNGQVVNIEAGKQLILQLELSIAVPASVLAWIESNLISIFFGCDAARFMSDKKNISHLDCFACKKAVLDSTYLRENGRI